MSHLEERVSVRCPFAQAESRLLVFFDEHRIPDGDLARLQLHVDVPVPGRSTPLYLARSIVATLEPHHLATDMAPRFRVRWESEEPGPFPIFLGELVVEGCDDYDTFGLALDGTYAPPFGVFGLGFDMAIGQHIAHATAKNLLHQIARGIESAFGIDEALKHRPNATTTQPS